MKPSVTIEEGMEIGYEGARWRGRQAVRLAKATDAIHLEPGRHLLLARNGRGKTTLLKTLANLIPAMAGVFSVGGRRQYVDEELRFDPELTSRQIFRSFFQNGLFKTSLSFAERMELDVGKQYGKLSKGNRQKVALILAETRASDGEGHVLLLDEPFSGLDFHVRNEVDAIWTENQENVLRLVCVHPDEPTLQAESALLISEGRIQQHHAAGGWVDWMETRKTLN